METKHVCEDFESALIELIAAGQPVLENTVAEARRCAHCDGVLRSLSTLSGTLSTDGGRVPALAPHVEKETVVAAGRVARRVAWLFTVGRLILGTVLAAAWIAGFNLGLYSFRFATGIRWYAPSWTAESVSVLLGAIFVWYLGAIGYGTRRLYLRWPGHWVQGVCTGLSEYLGIPVWPVRTAFLLLFFTGWGGGSLYIACSVMLTFHPDDRQHLFNFRVQRMWRRWIGHSVQSPTA
jgi:phage shock protein PspC (stress-responsive transcriptional regulator)